MISFDASSIHSSWVRSGESDYSGFQDLCNKIATKTAHARSFTVILNGK